jgi:hypothetical protein
MKIQKPLDYSPHILNSSTSEKLFSLELRILELENKLAMLTKSQPSLITPVYQSLTLTGSNEGLGFAHSVNLGSGFSFKTSVGAGVNPEIGVGVSWKILGK